MLDGVVSRPRVMRRLRSDPGTRGRLRPPVCALDFMLDSNGVEAVGPVARAQSGEQPTETDSPGWAGWARSPAAVGHLLEPNCAAAVTQGPNRPRDPPGQ